MFGKPTLLSTITAMGGFDLEELLINNTRYYLERLTGAADTYARLLARNWSKLSDQVRHSIQKDVELAIQQDNIVRQYRAQVGDTSLAGLPLGSTTHRQAWEELRACWLIPVTTSGA